MYEVNELVDKQFNIYELKDSSTNSWVKVAPERGGIIFSYGVEGQELFYLNEDTFYNEDKNVRGGNPILFPISGQLPDKAYEWEGKTYSMNNHGFARNAEWEVVDRQTNDRAALTIKLTSNEATRVSYPFDFEVVFVYELKNGKLTIHQEYKNIGNEPMPIYAGFHPYFKTNNKHIAYDTDATKYYDYNDGKEKEFTGSIDITNFKEAVVLLDAKQNHISFEQPTIQKRVKLSYDSSFKYVVLWTEADQDFICVEPWMAKNGELSRKEELVIIDKNNSHHATFSIQVEE